MWMNYCPPSGYVDCFGCYPAQPEMALQIQQPLPPPPPGAVADCRGGFALESDCRPVYVACCMPQPCLPCPFAKLHFNDPDDAQWEEMRACQQRYFREVWGLVFGQLFDGEKQSEGGWQPRNSLPSSEPKPKPAAKPAAKPDAKPAAKAGGKSDGKSPTKAGPDAKAAGKSDAKAAEKSGPGGKSDGKSPANPGPGAKAGEKSDAKAAGKADAKQTGKADAKADGKADAKQTGKADAKQTGKADAKAGAKADEKPVAKSPTTPKKPGAPGKADKADKAGPADAPKKNFFLRYAVSNLPGQASEVKGGVADDSADQDRNQRQKNAASRHMAIPPPRRPSFL